MKRSMLVLCLSALALGSACSKQQSYSPGGPSPTPPPADTSSPNSGAMPNTPPDQSKPSTAPPQDQSPSGTTPPPQDSSTPPK